MLHRWRQSLHYGTWDERCFPLKAIGQRWNGTSGGRGENGGGWWRSLEGRERIIERRGGSIWRWYKRCSCLGPRHGYLPPIGELPRRVPPPGGTEDGGNGPQSSVVRDMGVTTHWSGANNGGIGINRGIHRPPPEHGRAIHCDPSYHGLVFGGGADARNAPIHVMVVTSRPGYHGDQGGAGSRGGEGGDRGGRIGFGGRGRVGEGWTTEINWYGIITGDASAEVGRDRDIK